jgi:hypothetical protein
MHWFTELQRAQLAALDAINPAPAKLVRAHDAVYLYGTIGSEAVLLRDGEVRLWWSENWPASEEYSERLAAPRERTASIALGARKYPQLLELLPTRPIDAPACATCGGAGFVGGGDGIVCPTCDGLGSVPAVI